jgi:hypothetical protein
VFDDLHAKASLYCLSESIVFFRSADAVPEYACGIAWWQIGINRKDVPFLILPESTA